MSTIARTQERTNIQLRENLLPQTHEAFRNSRISELVQSYLFNSEPENFPLFHTRVAEHFLPKSINFQEASSLKSYLDPALQKYVMDAILIAKRCLDVRSIVGDDDKYGYAYPMQQEVLAYAIDCAKDKIALEIGGASGENAMILAFGGAKHVYMNDITTAEITNFRELAKTLPFEIQKKLTPIEGNCLELGQLKPELQGKIDLVLSRNLIHLLPQVQLDQFFAVLKKTLKPGGIAILSANAIYGGDVQALEVYKDNPNETAFTQMFCKLYDRSKSTDNIQRLDDFCFPGAPMKDSFETQYGPIYDRKPPLTSWKPVFETSEMLIPAMRKNVMQTVKTHKKTVNAIKNGYVYLVFQFYRAFSKENLRKLVQHHGFEVKSTFVTSREGHLVDDAHLYTEGHQIGVIIRSLS